jgi:hypothetical protein
MARKEKCPVTCEQLLRLQNRGNELDPEMAVEMFSHSKARTRIDLIRNV